MYKPLREMWGRGVRNQPLDVATRPEQAVNLIGVSTIDGYLLAVDYEDAIRRSYERYFGLHNWYEGMGELFIERFSDVPVEFAVEILDIGIAPTRWRDGYEAYDDLANQASRVELIREVEV